MMSTSIPPAPSTSAAKGSAASTAHPAANRVLFVDTDEASGEEIWAPPAKGDRVDEGERWKRIMRWPRIPTIEEAMTFKLSVQQARLAKWWERLREARDLDERLDLTGPDDKQKPPKASDGSQK